MINYELRIMSHPSSSFIHSTCLCMFESCATEKKVLSAVLILFLPFYYTSMYSTRIIYKRSQSAAVAYSPFTVLIKSLCSVFVESLS